MQDQHATESKGQEGVWNEEKRFPTDEPRNVHEVDSNSISSHQTLVGRSRRAPPSIRPPTAKNGELKSNGLVPPSPTYSLFPGPESSTLPYSRSRIARRQALDYRTHSTPTQPPLTPREAAKVQQRIIPSTPPPTPPPPPPPPLPQQPLLQNQVKPQASIRSIRRSSSPDRLNGGAQLISNKTSVRNKSSSSESSSLPSSSSTQSTSSFRPINGGDGEGTGVAAGSNIHANQPSSPSVIHNHVGVSMSSGTNVVVFSTQIQGRVPAGSPSSPVTREEREEDEEGREGKRHLSEASWRAASITDPTATTTTAAAVPPAITRPHRSSLPPAAHLPPAHHGPSHFPSCSTDLVSTARTTVTFAPAATIAPSSPPASTSSTPPPPTPPSPHDNSGISITIAIAAAAAAAFPLPSPTSSTCSPISSNLSHDDHDDHVTTDSRTSPSTSPPRQLTSHLIRSPIISDTCDDVFAVHGRSSDAAMASPHDLAFPSDAITPSKPTVSPIWSARQAAASAHTLHGLGLINKINDTTGRTSPIVARASPPTTARPDLRLDTKEEDEEEQPPPPPPKSPRYTPTSPHEPEFDHSRNESFGALSLKSDGTLVFAESVSMGTARPTLMEHKIPPVPTIDPEFARSFAATGTSSPKDNSRPTRATRPSPTKSRRPAIALPSSRFRSKVIRRSSTSEEEDVDDHDETTPRAMMLQHNSLLPSPLTLTTSRETKPSIGPSFLENDMTQNALEPALRSPPIHSLRDRATPRPHPITIPDDAPEPERLSSAVFTRSSPSSPPASSTIVPNELHALSATLRPASLIATDNGTSIRRRESLPTLHVGPRSIATVVRPSTPQMLPRSISALSHHSFDPSPVSGRSENRRSSESRPRPSSILASAIPPVETFNSTNSPTARGVRKSTQIDSPFSSNQVDAPTQEVKSTALTVDHTDVRQSIALAKSTWRKSSRTPHDPPRTPDPHQSVALGLDSIVDPKKTLEELAAQCDALHEKYALLRAERQKLSSAMAAKLNEPTPSPNLAHEILYFHLQLNAVTSSMDICLAKLKSLDCQKEDAVAALLIQASRYRPRSKNRKFHSFVSSVYSLPPPREPPIYSIATAPASPIRQSRMHLQEVVGSPAGLHSIDARDGSNQKVRKKITGLALGSDSAERGTHPVRIRPEQHVQIPNVAHPGEGNQSPPMVVELPASPVHAGTFITRSIHSTSNASPQLATSSTTGLPSHGPPNASSPVVPRSAIDPSYGTGLSPLAPVMPSLSAPPSAISPLMDVPMREKTLLRIHTEAKSPRFNPSPSSPWDRPTPKKGPRKSIKGTALTSSMIVPIPTTIATTPAEPLPSDPDIPTRIPSGTPSESSAPDDPPEVSTPREVQQRDAAKVLTGSKLPGLQAIHFFIDDEYHDFYREYGPSG